MNIYQSTLANKVILKGHGLHSGRDVKVEIIPARSGEGISFVRSDIRGSKAIKACVENVSSTDLCTTLGVGHDQISTVEHLLSAIAGLSIDNAKVLVDGPEIPILDGSAEPFVNALLATGLKRQSGGRKYYIIKREFQLRDGNQFIKVEPYHRLQINYSIEFGTKVIGRQALNFDYSASEYRRLAAARTFCHRKDVETMWKAGLAKGGSLDNAVVVDDEKVLNSEGLRYSDEFVRHKVLDLIGDLSLLQSPLIGKITVEKGGHALHTNFVRQLREFRRELLTSIEPAIALTDRDVSPAEFFEAAVQYS